MVAALAVWVWVVAQEGLFRSSFFDDAFIYLAVARNVIETGSAEIFPGFDNGGLIASSPLRLLILVVAYPLARLVAGVAPSLDLARATFLLSAGIAMLPVWLLAHTRRAVLHGVVVAGLLSATTNTMLQMEGMLVFWCAYGLVVAIEREASNWQVAGLLTTIGLVRLEYGIAAVVAVAILRGRGGAWRCDLRAFAAVAAVAAVLWIAVAVSLGVWPIPSTFLTKVQTGELKFFGDPFLRSMAEAASAYVPLSEDKSTQRVQLGIGCVVVGALLWRYRGGRSLVLWLLLVVLILACGPGNYAWYHENLLVALVGGVLGLVGSSADHASVRRPVVLLLMALLVLLTMRRGGANDTLAWRFEQPTDYGSALRELGRHHRGGGRFCLGEFGGPLARPVALSTCEIGILAFFAGPTCWLHDTGGLAQAGQLRGVEGHALACFYPGELLRTADEEFARLRERVGRLPLYRLEPGRARAIESGIRIGASDLGVRLVQR